jgi:hypothetical protein
VLVKDTSNVVVGDSLQLGSNNTLGKSGSDDESSLRMSSLGNSGQNDSLKLGQILSDLKSSDDDDDSGSLLSGEGSSDDHLELSGDNTGGNNSQDDGSSLTSASLSNSLQELNLDGSDLSTDLNLAPSGADLVESLKGLGASDSVSLVQNLGESGDNSLVPFANLVVDLDAKSLVLDLLGNSASAVFSSVGGSEDEED